MPSIRPATIAPGTLPSPPSSMTIRPFTAAPSPMNGEMPLFLMPVEHAGDARDARADDEGDQHHAVDVDAEQRGGLVVLGGRADGAAHLGALDEQPEQHHQRDRDAEDEDLRRADRDRPEVIERLPDGLGKRQLLAAEDVDREVLQHDGEPDRADQRRQRAVLADRADRDEHRDARRARAQATMAPSSAP